jgi:probable phosphoglycerate mutase
VETRLLLLRHGQSAAPDRFHGAESDIGLSAEGLRQAESVARRLALIPPDAVFSSAMSRARQTALPIAAACGLTAEVVEALHERRMGTLSGRLKAAEDWDDYVAETERWMAGELEYAREGAESFAETRDRALGALQPMVEQATGRTIVVVAHGVLIRTVLASLVEGLGPADFHRIGIDNVAINDLRWDGTRWRAEALNQAPERLA